MFNRFQEWAFFLPLLFFDNHTPRVVDAPNDYLTKVELED